MFVFNVGCFQRTCLVFVSVKSLQPIWYFICWFSNRSCTIYLVLVHICGCICAFYYTHNSHFFCISAPYSSIYVFTVLSGGHGCTIFQYICEKQQILKSVSYCDDCSINVSAYRACVIAAHCSF